MTQAYQVSITTRDAELAGTFTVPARACGTVVFAHGSGSSRFSPRNRRVAEHLHGLGLATLLFDLLTEAEERVDRSTGRLRFDIALLSQRLIDTVDWLQAQSAQMLPDDRRRLGLFGASTGAAAALVAASARPDVIGAVVSRGGRPDLAGEHLRDVVAATLLIVGGNDRSVIDLNEQAARQLQCRHRLVIVPGATHLFEEAGALEQVAQLAGQWFTDNLRD